MGTGRVGSVSSFVVVCALAVCATIVSCAGVATRSIGGREVLPERAHAPRESSIDVEHYALSLVLDPLARQLAGSCTLRLAPRVDALREVALDLEGLKVARVSDARGRTLAFEHADGSLRIALPEPAARGELVELAIAYSGAPAKGLWFAAERDGVATQAFTQGQCDDARWWFPCVDEPSDRATSELEVVLPAGWSALAAGELVERAQLDDGRVRERWRMPTPHPTYLTTLVAGELAVERERWNNVPLAYACRPELREHLAPTFDETGRMLDFFSELTGVRYPYAKYSQACVDNFLMGGMENISATTLSETVLTDERGRRDYDATDLLAHELAHQWFGDLATCNDWSHIWLNEGFATYAALLYAEATRGPDAFRAGVREMQDEYLAADRGPARRPVVWNVYREPMDLFFTGQVYPGGGSRLHYLRFVLGDEAFFRGLELYVRENRGRGVVTDDFERAMESASGVELDEFFAQWLRAPGYPEFEIRWTWDESASLVRLRVEQVQAPVRGTPTVFRGPAQVEIRTDAGSERVRVDVERRVQTFELAAPSRPTWVVFDEYGSWPALIACERSRGEWLALLAGDDDLNSRADAARALGQAMARPLDEEERWRVAEAVLEALAEDDSEVVRAAAARAFGTVHGSADHPVALALMRAAAGDDASSVRIAALETLTSWDRSAAFADFGRAQFDAGYSYVTMTAAAALVVLNDAEGGCDWLISKLDMPSPHDALRAGLLNVLGTLPGSKVIEELRRRALDENAATASREIAVRSLGVCAKHLGDVRNDLARQLATTRGYRLQSALIDALAAFGDGAAREALSSYYTRCVDPRQRRAIERSLARPAGGP